jgi:hypothetical protein
MIFSINNAAMVEALYELGIHPNIVTTLVSARYDGLREVLFRLLGAGLAAAGAQQELPKDIPSIVAFLSQLSTQGGLTGSVVTSDVSDAGYSYVIENCMFSTTRDILLEKRPGIVPPCFLSSLIAGLIKTGTGRVAKIESLEIINGKCKIRAVVD